MGLILTRDEPRIIMPRGIIPAQKHGFSGRFRAVLMDQNERVLRDTGFIDNMITNSGLRQIGEPSSFRQLYVGTNGAATTLGMTAMQAFLDENTASNASGFNVNGQGVAPNYEYSGLVRARFTTGEAVGTIAEFGIGASYNGTGTLLIARQVVTPAIVKATEHILDLFYEWTHWPDLTTRTFNGITIGSNDYDITLRSSNLDTDTTYPYRQCGVLNTQYYYLGGPGTIGATYTDAPSGLTDSCADRVSYGTVTADGDEWYRDCTVTSEIDSANFVDGYITIGKIRYNQSIYFQCDFQADGLGPLPAGTGIPKDDTEEVELTWRVYWGRHP